MRITNICLSGPYNENWGYQDNLLPKYQRLNGNDVSIITSRHVNDKNSDGYLVTELEEYTNSYGVHVLRIDFKFGEQLARFFRTYKNLYHELEKQKPDLIFVHGCQFMDALEVCRYAKNHPDVEIRVDNHADESNSAKNFLPKLVHYTLWRYCANRLNKYASIFYGVMPSRVQFLNKYYGIPITRTDVLVMGIDDELVEKSKEFTVEYRMKHHCEDQFVIVTGGKIDLHKKDTIELMKAVKNMERCHLFVFGSVVDELKEDFERNLSDNITYLNWINQEEICKYIAMADLAVFPGRHSVVWEQCVGLSIPIVVKDWTGMNHLGTEGNCIFLNETNETHLRAVLENLCENKDVYEKMKKAALKKKDDFLYSRIAYKSVYPLKQEGQ